MLNLPQIAIILLLVGSFYCGLKGATKQSVVHTSVGVILLTIAILVSVLSTIK